MMMLLHIYSKINTFFSMLAFAFRTELEGQFEAEDLTSSLKHATACKAGSVYYYIL